jgi:beta-glucosidase
MDSFDVNVCLGPGMNIHRDPLCGRNFEYYSEDPLITGVAAKEFTLGVQSHKGRGVSIKHFLTNNQENDRLTLNNTVSIRALREIYLAGFETVVKEANPMTIMTCYNKLNGYHTSSNRELLTDIVRGEWGFKNYIMTDWGTTSTKPEDYHAGNDLVMGGLNISYILQALRDLPPEFNPNGGIKKEVISTYGGFMKETRECWNSFLPLKDGKDQVTTVISQDVKPDPQVLKDVQDGKCIINKEIDGKLTVKYFGTHLGACLPLGDIQACAIRLLKGLMNSAAMTEMLNNLK